MSDNKSNKQTDESPPLPSSQDLFEKMLEEQLRKEEERLKSQPAVQTKPKIPHKPFRAKNKNALQQRKEQEEIPEATIHHKTPEPKTSNSSSEQQETAAEQKSLHSSGSKTPRPAEIALAEPVPKKRKISQENPFPVTTTVNMEEQPPGLSSNELFERQLEEQLKKHNEEANMQESAATGELSQRLCDKNWKTRKEAYDELSNLFSSAQSNTDPCFETHATVIHKLVQDKHANSLESGLSAVLHFVTGYKYAARTAEEVVPHIIDKCLTGKTGKKALDILLLYIEIDIPTIVMNELMKGFQHKTPKNRAACIETITTIIRTFGVPTINVKELLKTLAKLFDDSDAKVRQEATKLTVELYRWIRDAVKSYIKDCRQAEELEKQFKEVKNDATPERTLRSHINAPVQKLGNSYQKHSEKVTAQSFTVDELIEAENVLSKIPKTFREDVTAQKWQTRKEALEELLRVINKPKLQQGDYSELCSTLFKIIKEDKTIMVVKVAIDCITCLSQGLGMGFSSSARQITVVLFEKFKDAKLLESVTAALNSFDKCLILSDFIDDIVNSCKSKTTATKINSIVWLEKKLSTKSRDELLKVMKLIGQTLLELTEDPSKEVRDFCCKAFGRLVWAIGEKDAGVFLSKLDKQKEERVREIAMSLGPSPVSMLPANLSSSISVTENIIAVTRKQPPKPVQPVQQASTGPTMKPPTTRPATAPSVPTTTRSKLQTSAPAKPSTAKPTNRKKVNKSAIEHLDDKPPRILYTQDEAAAKIQEFIPEKILTSLESKNYKERLEGLESLAKFVDGLNDTLDEHCEILFRLICTKPGWKETNVQVMVKAIEIITSISEKKPKQAKLAAHITANGMVSKLGTAKINDAVKICLSNFAERAGPQFVFNTMYKNLPEQKTPKIIAEGIQWMTSTISEFGIKKVKVDKLIEFVKGTLENTNPTVKKEATQLLCVMKRFLGNTLLNFLSDIKPALKSAIEKEFEKIPDEPAPTAVKRILGDEEEEEEGDSGVSSNAMDLLPRIDISSQVTSKLIKDLTAPAWQTRHQALSTIEKIINDANKRIAPTVGELFNELKKRLDDTNEKIIRTTLSLLTLIVTAMGPAIEKNSKFILPSVVTKLFDTKKPIRSCTSEVIESWVKETTLAPMIKYFPKAFSNDKGHPEGRRDLLAFIAKHSDTVKGKQIDNILPIVPIIIDGLQDPKHETRKLAESLIPFVVQHVGGEPLIRSCRDLKQVIRETISPIIDKYCSKEQPSVTIEDTAMDLVDSKLPEPTKTLDKKSVSAIKVEPKEKRISKEPEAKGLIVVTNMKEVRANRRKTKWFFENNPTPEQTKEVIDGMGKCMLGDLCTMLFSSNGKLQVQGIEMLLSGLDFYTAELMDNLDIIIQYVTLKLADPNPTIQNSVLQLLVKSVEVLQKAKYQFIEFEAGLLLPILTDRMSHNISAIKDTIKQLLQQLRSVCHPKKIFFYVLETALRNKNGKTRLDCIIEMTDLLCQFNTVALGPPSIMLPKIAVLLTEPEPIKSSALNFFVQANKIVGGEFWSCISTIEQVSKDLIRSKLQNTGSSVAREPFTKPFPQPVEFKLDEEEINRKYPKIDYNPLSVPIEVLEVPVNPMPTPRVPDRASIEALFANRGVGGQQVQSVPELLGCITVEATTVDLTITTLKQLDALCKEQPNSVRAYLKSVINVLVLNTSKAFVAASRGTVPIRLAKYLLNSMIQLYQNKKLVEWMDTQSLTLQVDHVLRRLLDENLPNLEDGQNLLRALNALMLKILEHSDRTRMYSTLITLMSNSGQDESMKKYTELVVKCLLKLTRTLASTIQTVDVDQLLSDFHEFLTKNPPSQFTKGKDDLALRTVKTILNELVKIKGEAIRGNLSFVPTHENPLIVNYIDVILKSNHVTQKPPTPLSVAPVVAQSAIFKSSPSSNILPSATSDQLIPIMNAAVADIDPRQQLKEILKQIGNQKTSRSGLFMLHKFTKQYPQIELEPYLQKCSDNFREYITRQLEKIRQHDSRSSPQLSVSVSLPQSQQLTLPSSAQNTVTSCNGNGNQLLTPNKKLSAELNETSERFLKFSSEVSKYMEEVTEQQPKANTSNFSSLDLAKQQRKMERTASSFETIEQLKKRMQEVENPLCSSLNLSRDTQQRAKSEDEKENLPSNESSTLSIVSLRERLANLQKKH